MANSIKSFEHTGRFINDMSQYQELFVTEARKHTLAVRTLLERIKKGEANQDIVDELLFRAHSIKGMAAAMGYQTLRKVVADIERLLVELRSYEELLLAEVIALLQAGIKRLCVMIAEIEGGKLSTP